MGRAFRWLARYWYIPLLAVGAVVGWIVLAGRTERPSVALNRELQAIRAGEDARRLEAEQGREEALARVEVEHAERLAALDEKQKLKAEALRGDPARLSRFLVRAGRS